MTERVATISTSFPSTPEAESLKPVGKTLGQGEAAVFPDAIVAAMCVVQSQGQEFWEQFTGRILDPRISASIDEAPYA